MISIITATYNAAKTLADNLACIAGQSLLPGTGTCGASPRGGAGAAPGTLCDPIPGRYF
ncbi:hypothetical protein EDC39_107144 [Geothermobacter ehrlichii]|uniref:Uncharacterized protein n=1 Tax=Geothermobacter ehrlichii TaxID=213224 RepID=A0A5D3WLG3_9BACT|nr:hypothetical protein EDC39_107144 [Geothermobacter ehrlichii]